ncbi:5'/3'-nucleotidase SurE [Lichenicoccus sp.]|uniref:5'/3'-nucleotidase SurE n=1 Tax=Lichenicoccus sp. TaxID=2781899 RepID=UPI003D11F3A2
MDPIFDRVLLTNDDGIAAPGLAVLEQVAVSLAREVWVVAPAHDQSGTSHSLSLHAPLRIETLGERRFSVQGTPADCVVLGVRHLMRDASPDMILSGVNRGANLGVETVFSGTVGAAMTGLLLGVPSIALSQAFEDRDAVPWPTASALAGPVIRRLACPGRTRSGWSGSACLNVNFPACAPDAAGPLTVTRQGEGLLDGIEILSRADPRTLDYHWLQISRRLRRDAADSEAAALDNRAIAVTPLRFERTDDAVLELLREAVRA